MKFSRTLQEQYDAIERRARLLGLSPDELCRRAGLSAGIWYKWTKGGHTPNALSLLTVFHTLDRLQADRFEPVRRAAASLNHSIDPETWWALRAAEADAAERRAA